MTITENPYFLKIILTIIAVIIKLVLDSIMKDENELKGLQKLFSFAIYFALPAVVILWLNLDTEIKDSKINTTLIAFNFALIIFNYFQSKINTQNQLISKFGKIESEKIKEINHINAVQVEKIIALNDNQKYILSEVSKINDRIIEFFKEKNG